MTIYAIGDIQGCYDEMRRLLDLVKFSPESDRLWCVGDMVNRGPKSLEVLRYLKSLGSAYTGVLGNHDLHFLAVASGAYTEGKVRTMLPLLEAPDLQELFDWVRSLPLAHRETLETTRGTTKFLMVHAGMAPGWKIKQTVKLAREVEAVLQGQDYKPFLGAMYGNRPERWQEDLTGMERLRVITNILTRIRFCKPDGELNFSVKTEADTAPPGYEPWFQLRKAKSGKVILFGHWATLDGRTNREDIYGLDTGCVWGRAMTLLQLDNFKHYQVSCSHLL